MSGIKFPAVLAAAASSFLVGGLWYSPKPFDPAWQREAGDSRKQGEGHPAKVFGVSCAFALLAALFALYGLIVGLWRAMPAIFLSP